VAPVNRIPPNILALVPDFWDKHHYGTDQDVIALTHVCRAWRGVFISRSSLWTNLDCKSGGKTRIYLERSKFLPVSLSLDAGGRLSSNHPFLKIIPHVIGRLGSLTVEGTPKNLQYITDRLSRPAPLLERLFIHGDYDYGPSRNPVLPPTLFNGDLSSLRELKLESVRTELPWRNMVNLTSITLIHISWGEDSVKQLLDFFRKMLLTSAQSVSSQSQPVIIKMGGWYHWRIWRGWRSPVVVRLSPCSTTC
jgi:hypothetical protein